MRKETRLMEGSLKRKLAALASRYETAAFLDGDPSFFMHQARGRRNAEATAFVAAALSFGSRSVFMGKLRLIFSLSRGDMDGYVRDGGYAKDFRPGDKSNFYRFFSRGDMNSFFGEYSSVLSEYGTLGSFVRERSGGDALGAVKAICLRFAGKSGGLIPADSKSACKRLCMFLRWMVRGGSPVDLGLWEDFMDRSTLVIPLDTHVAAEAARLGLLKRSSASMSAALKLTAALAEAFPGDPCRGDYALFGLGVDRSGDGKRRGAGG